MVRTKCSLLEGNADTMINHLEALNILLRIKPLFNTPSTPVQPWRLERDSQVSLIRAALQHFPLGTINDMHSRKH